MISNLSAFIANIISLVFLIRNFSNKYIAVHLNNLIKVHVKSSLVFIKNLEMKLGSWIEVHFK